MKLPSAEWFVKVVTTVEKCPKALMAVVSLAAIAGMAYMKK